MKIQLNLNTLKVMVTALSVNKSLPNTVYFKNLQLDLSVFITIVGLVSNIFNLGIPDEDIKTISTGLFELLVFTNYYFTLATSKTIGLN